MYQYSFTSPPGSRTLAALGAAAVFLLCPQIHGQTITNPSFESNTFAVAPGLISDNSAITGWTAAPDTGAGLNPAGGSSVFADNGAIPEGKNVAFISGGTTLSTVLTGLTSGQTYKLTFRANAPTNQVATLRASIGDQEKLAVSVYPVGSTNPYAYFAFEFPATATSETLNLLNDAAPEQTLLLDQFVLALSNGKWVVDAWTGDADSGVDSNYVYTHAYSFGSAGNAVINGVPFTGVAGANPTVSNKFSTTLFGNVFNNDANNVTGGGAALAKDFIYSGANVTAGTYQSITLRGLTPGTEYVATIYSVAFDSPTPGIRWATLSSGADYLTFNQDQFDNNNGIKMSYRYTADATGSATLRLAPVNPVNVSIHVYGFSNREAVSRNVAPAVTLQPSSTTVAQGVPLALTVSASGFPAPTYQWRFNGTNLTGANAATYTIAQASSQIAGLYEVVLSNSLGSVTSKVARVTVGLPMTNPSFEADSFISWPGYSGDNNPGDANSPAGANIPITGWTQGDLNGSGINPTAAGSAPFADNGVIPNGMQVAFIQADTTLSQTVSGLTAGSQYYVHYYENARSGPNPALELRLDANTLVPAHLVTPVGGSTPYHEIYSDVFTATGTSAELVFAKSNPLGGDSTVLIDNVAVVPVPPGTAPTILREPEARLVSVGDSAIFSVQFLGSLPVTYQWSKNGAPISGATNATLTLNNITGADEADYSVKVTNSAGTGSSAIARLTVAIPGVFGTGLGADGKPLAAGETDPHYTMKTSADTDFPGPAALVVNDAWPVQAGVWLLNGPDSKWIAPQADQGTGNAEGDYVYQTTFDLTGFDVSRINLVGGWAVDNAGTDILVNGTSSGITSSGFGSLTPFVITSGLVAGKNTLEFKVNNAPATPNPTALRVDLKAISVAPPVSGASLQIARSGNNLIISWPATPAGQKLQSAPNVTGPWTDLAAATSPYTVTPTAARAFYRTAR